MDVSSPWSELDELRDMLKQQQEQLSQLTQGFARLQGSRLRNPSPRRGPVICRRCQQVGHFARDCEGERVPPCPGPSSMAESVAGGGQMRFAWWSEN